MLTRKTSILKAKNKNKGMTLVEIIVAMAIFGVMSVTLLLIFSSGFAMTVRAGNREKAIVDSASLLDEYKYDEYALSGLVTATYDSSSLSITLDSGNSYTVPSAWSIETFATDPSREVNGESSHMEGFRIK